jgi:hypothetical protein
MEDRLGSLVGRTVQVEQPCLGRPHQKPETFRVTNVIGLMGILEPIDAWSITNLRPGVPLALYVEGSDPVSRIDAVIVEPPAGRQVVQVRLPKLPERREVVRHAVSFPATIQVIGAAAREEHPELSATVVDLSLGGVRLATSEPIPAGERAFVSLAIPGEVPVLAIADVAGEPFVVGGRHHVRLAFSMIGDDERGRLVRHLSGGAVSFTPVWG